MGSKLAYSITVWCRIPVSLDEDAATRTSPSITKEDVLKIQVLQHKCIREAFQTRKRGKFGPGPSKAGGLSKKLGKVQKSS